MCEISLKNEGHIEGSHDHEEDYFLIRFGILELPSFDRLIALVYFSFTSLSTVGLGDLHPRSCIERACGALMLLFGVAVTSFVTQNLNEMIGQLQNLNKGFTDESRLSLFFGILERFNGGDPLDKNLKKQMEEHFQHRWANDRNFAVS